MNLKQGDLVKVDGVESKVETHWGQGKHKMFKLADGRLIMDLDKAVASGGATIITPKAVEVETQKWKLPSSKLDE